MSRLKKTVQEDAQNVTKVYIWALLVVSCILIVRFTQLMIFKTVNGQDLTQIVAQQYNRNTIVAAKRGNIYDISGETLATDIKLYSMYAVLTDKYKGTKYVVDKPGAARVLAKYISMDETAILRLLNQEGLNQTAFGNAGLNLTHEVKEAIESEKIDGIYFTEKIARDYPKGYFANNLIGLARDTREDTTVETQKNPLNGVMGLELMYDTQLKGIDGLVNYDKDFYGYSVPGTQQVIERVQDGNNIYTTLDSKLTEYLDELVGETYDKYNPVSVMAMVIRPKTGSVVALSQRPTFNAKSQLYPEDGWINKAVESAYEPGSTMKVISLAAAVNEGIFSPMELYQSGSVEVADVVINDWNRKGWGKITYLQGISYSSNVAFVNLISQLGYDKWKGYLDAFGFGKSTNSGLANENKGVNTYGDEVTRASTSFGQGISVTMLQMMQAFSAIANEGTMQKLRFVDRIENTETKEITYTPVESVGTPIRPETAKQVLAYLEEVVYGEGEDTTGRIYQVDGIRISGKSGTAQVIDEKTGAYYKQDYLHSWVQFMPNKNPEYILYIIVDRPKSSSGLWSSEISVPFTKFAMQYLSNQDDAVAALENKTIPDATGASVEKTKEAFETLGFKDIVVLGSGDIVHKQMPLDNLAYTIDTKIMVATDGVVQMPNIIGWSRADVLKLERLIGIKVVYEGDGFVATQSIQEGSIIDANSQLTVGLTSKQSRTPISTTIQSTTQPTTKENSR